ncbi:hypothetical protein NDU88_003857 [Pleurodeles waltl]|uniref:Secreted protein n=1 Tax=Pleurodeles waltl TaxID=8319 RepID=A0AAV7MEY9_PLEWA|nr:hypothetical protein NDU88_003857 [Pleurodeles waltl]
MPHSLMFCFVMLFSPLVAKVSEPLVSLVGRREGPQLYETFSAEGRSEFTVLSQLPFWVVAAAKFLKRVFRVISAPGWSATVPTCAVYSPIASLQSPRPPVVTMSEFKLWAWNVARRHHTMPHLLMFRFVLLPSSFVAKVSEPPAPSNEWCGGPHLYRTVISSQLRAAAVTGSLLCRGRHFGSRQPQSCWGEFSG